MNVYTIGFTQSSAESFFSRLQQGGVKRLVDVRLNNVSQLAGFAKRADLEYFCKTICGIEYIHLPLLAPTQELLDQYRKDGGSWDDYAERFLGLMRERRIENLVAHETLDGACLLCSEAKPHKCHRRLVVEYLRDKWGNMAVRHL